MDRNIKFLKAMADDTRIKILQCLLNGEQCACAIVPCIGKAQPTVSKHLKVLEEAEIIESRRDGINIWYKINSDKAVKIMDILGIERIEYEGSQQCARPAGLLKAARNLTK
jgi:ArsR family transcriptional regulator